MKVWKSSETDQMRISKGSVFPTCYIKELDTVTCVLAESQRQAEEWESSVVGKKGKASGVPWWNDVGMEKLEASYLEGGASCVVV